MLLHSQRRKLHAAVVTGMELLYAQDLDLHCGQLAFHSREAGLLEKACTYLVLAGNSARDTYHNALAANYYQQALEIIPESAVDQRYLVLLEHEAMVKLLGWHVEQRQDLEQLTGLAIQLDQIQAGHLPEIKKRWGTYYLRNGEYEQSIAQTEIAFRLAEVEKNSAIMVEALLTMANANFRMARYELAMHQAEEALELSQLADDLPRKGEAWNMLGLISLEIEEPDKIYHFFEEGLKIAQVTGKLWVEAMIWNNLGNLAGMQGNFSQSQDYFQKALELARETGNRRGEGLVLGNLGWIAGMLGEYGSARRFCEQNLRIANEAGDQETKVINLTNLSSIAERQQDYSAAQSYGEQAIELAQQTGNRSAAAWAYLFIGHVFMGLSQPDVAISHFQQSLAIREELSQSGLACEPRAGLALALLADGKVDQALEQVRLILEYMDGGGTLDGTDEPMRVYLSCIVGLESINHPRAQSLLEAAYQMIQERASKITSEPSRRSFLEKVPYHQEIIRRWNNCAMGCPKR
jgi:tetratricopeptide (TPR) repeat protein